MLLQIKAKHYKNAPFLSMHDCPTCNALNELFPDAKLGFNGTVISFSNTENYGIGPNRNNTYTEHAAKADYANAKLAGYDETIIRVI